MAIVVQKYGGSSVADLAKLHRVSELIARGHAAGEQLVVVVSAMAKTTEQLIELARDAARLPGADTPGHVPRRELDMLVSTGERVSMALLSIALQARGIDAVSFTGSQSGIITDQRHFDARILEIRPERIVTELERARVVIVAGYQGMSRAREITTLGRGGSDTTAVALAAVLGGARCEIYSDVDGVYTADPRVVPGARHLPELGYETMHLMAERGAKVLNVRAVDWARRYGVAVHARCTADHVAAAGSARETVLGRTEPPLRAIVADEQLALLRIPRAAEAALRAALADWDLDGCDRRDDGREVLLALSLLNVPDLSLLSNRVRSIAPDAALEPGWAAISAVGPAADVAAFESRGLGLLGMHVSCSFRSPGRLSAVVPRAASGDCQRVWHYAFVDQDSLRAA